MCFILPSPLTSVFLRNQFCIPLTLWRLSRAFGMHHCLRVQMRVKNSSGPTCVKQGGGCEQLQQEPKYTFFPAPRIPLLFHEPARNTSELSQTGVMFNLLTDSSTKSRLGPLHSCTSREGVRRTSHCLHWLRREKGSKRTNSVLRPQLPCPQGWGCSNILPSLGLPWRYLNHTLPLKAEPCLKVLHWSLVYKVTLAELV